MRNASKQAQNKSPQCSHLISVEQVGAWRSLAKTTPPAYGFIVAGGVVVL